MQNGILGIHELSNKHRRFLKLAKELADTSTYGIFRHGAVLTSGSCILGLGVNNDKYCSIGAKYRSYHKGISTYHAEIGAVINIPRHVTKGCTIYVARTSKFDGTMRMSKPCPMCEAILRERGVKRVFYSVDEMTVGTYKP